MLWSIALIQISVFIIFVALENIWPARQLQQSPGFYRWWIFTQTFSLMWLQLLFIIMTKPLIGLIQWELGVIELGALFFFVYSFFNYWWHRFKHSNSVIWRYIHRFHHAPSKMETALIFFKHPLEIIANSILIFFIAWVFSLPIEAVALGLLIEGIIETYHHSNIKTPKRLRWISIVIQTPEMHLIHHQKGLHKYNYVTFLWDTIFKTARIPTYWEGDLGLTMPNGIKGIFFFQKE